MGKCHEYDQNSRKTVDGELVSSYMCSPETAAEEFEISRRLYHQLTGRVQPEDKDIIMYRVIQSFKPGEISPEEAHKIGYELAMKFTEGKHQFVVSTHVDKRHIHTHIEFNSTNLNCDGKFHAHNSSFLLRRINDEICEAHGLSVIKNPKKKAKTQKETAAAQYGTSHKECLRQSIDRVLADCQDYEDFLARMRAEGYEVKEGKLLSFRLPEWDRFTRTKTLGDDYTREALIERANRPRGRSAEAEKPVVEISDNPGGEKASHEERLRQTINRILADCQDYEDFLARMRVEGYEVKEGKQLSFRLPGWDRFMYAKDLGEDYIMEALMKRANRPRGRSAEEEKPVMEIPDTPGGKKISRMIDIEKKMAEGKGAGYERWARIFNLQEAAKTMNFLVDNEIDHETLASLTKQAETQFNAASRKIKQLEARMAEVAQLKTHIIRYAKTKDVYAAYQKSRHKKEFQEEHAEEIAQHEAAKAAFDALGGKPIPKVAQLSEQYAALLTEKKACYAEYKEARQKMLDYQTMKHNLNKILGLDAQTEQTRRPQRRDR